MMVGSIQDVREHHYEPYIQEGIECKQSNIEEGMHQHGKNDTVASSPSDVEALDHTGGDHNHKSNQESSEYEDLKNVTKGMQYAKSWKRFLWYLCNSSRLPS